MDSMDKAPVTNQRVAEDLGVTHATISRIRSGDRLPSLALMLTIEKVTRWRLSAQVRWRQEGKYATAFEQMLYKHYEYTNEFVPPSAANNGLG